MEKQKKQTSEAAVREIRRRTRRKFSLEEKIRVVLEELRGEQSVAELCRREGIPSNLYCRWSKDFLEGGKKQLAGDTVREATSDEVKDLRSEASGSSCSPSSHLCTAITRGEESVAPRLNAQRGA
jgi:transposase